MENFKVTTTLDPRDWQSLLRAIRLRVAERTRPRGLLRFLPAAVWIAITAIAVWIFQTWPRLFNPESMLMAIALFVAFLLIVTWRQRRAMRPAADGAFFGPVEFTFTPEGFEVVRTNTHARNRWPVLRDVTQTATHVFLWTDEISAYPLRIADLPAPLTADEAVARIRAFAAAARTVDRPAGAETPGEISATAEAAPAPAPLQASPALPSVAQELSALLRVETRREVDPHHLFGRDLTILLLGLFSFGLWIGLDRLGYSGNVEILWYGLSGVGSLAAIGLLLAWMLSRLSSPRLPMRRALLLVVAASPIVAVGSWLAQNTSSPVGYYLVAAIGVAWITDLVHSGMRVMTGTHQARAIMATVMCFALVWYASTNLYVTTGFWYEPDQEEEPYAETSAEREQLLFEQASRIDAQVAGMKPGDPKRASMYFVGFAGYGEQRVFAQEIDTAARVVGDKYASDGRALLLVNDARDEEKYPFATGAALRHGLLALGRRMDPGKDALFLALSSHGSEDGTLSVSNEALMLWRDLSATDLRAMLDESGIRWRVIVVSACYAGSFIETLADERTIVLTAAAKERTSFGCSDDRDITYFGEAFYRDALPRAANLRAAFESARAAIGERERVEDMEPSEPQAHFGAEMEKKLAGMEVVSGGESRDNSGPEVTSP